MLSITGQNLRKNENTQTSEKNSNFVLEIFWKHDISLQLLGIHNSSAFYSTLIPFSLLKILVLAERQFSSDILVPFPDSHNLYSCDQKLIMAGGCVCNDWKPSFLPPIIFKQCAFSRQVTARFGHVGEQKINC